MGAMTHESLSRKLYPFLIFLLACLQYVNTVSYDYAWDDKLVITGNDYTTSGIKAIPDIFTKRVSIPYKSEYRPVPQALHAIEYQVFHGNPHAGHFFNIFWYALSCVLVFAFVRFTFCRILPLYAFLVALLFTVHPLHVEVVANIKGRDEILALFFGLSGMILLVKAIERLRWLPLTGGATCFVLACLSKSNAITLLPLVPLVVWYRASDSKPSRRLIASSAAVAVCCVAVVLLIRYVQNTVSSDLPVHLNSTVLNNIFLWSAHTDTIVPTALVIVGRYVLLFVYPHPLIHLYGYDQIALNHWTDLVTWVVIIGLIGVALLVAKTLPSKSPLAFGLMMFVITYSVYSNLFFFAPDTMADRYMFLPSLGMAIVVVYVLYRLASIDLNAHVLRDARAWSVVGVFTLALSAYFATTVVTNRDWQNDATLIHNRINYMENNAAAQAIYGHQLNKESAELATAQLRLQRKAAAMKAFTRAIEIYPDFQAAWIAIGRMFAERGIYDKAELSFLRAQRLEPLSPDAYFCLGTLYLAEQDTDLATPYLEKAVLLDPSMEDAYVMLGRAYLRANNIDNLGSMTATAQRWFPQNINVEALRATYLFRTQQYDQAFQLAHEVVARDPQNTLAIAVLSSPLAQSPSRR
jgi:tetratricopeptide (TPR) repeat protein